MPRSTFISFRGEDDFLVWSVRNLANFKNVSFSMDDVSLRQAINSRDESYIKSIIRPKIKSCDNCLCLIGENTHRSRKWVPWEINLAAENNKRIVAMRFNSTPRAITPSVLSNLGITPYSWDLDLLYRLLS